MIRRDTVYRGSPGWTLLSQVEHARLSGEMAAAWGEGTTFARLEPNEEVVAAIHHHDDGWRIWEQRPQVDPQAGHPFNFLEMPFAALPAIWQGSIAAAREIGPLAGYMVSGHFQWLTRRNDLWKESRAGEENLATHFDEEQQLLQQRWREDIRTHYPAEYHSDSFLETSVKWLRFFDWLSLWLCTQERSEAETFQVPEQPEVTFRPLARDEFAIEPWPFQMPELRLTISGPWVPEQHYTNREELALPGREEVTFTWLLRPGS